MSKTGTPTTELIDQHAGGVDAGLEGNPEPDGARGVAGTCIGSPATGPTPMSASRRHSWVLWKSHRGRESGAGAPASTPGDGPRRRPRPRAGRVRLGGPVAGLGLAPGPRTRSPTGYSKMPSSPIGCAPALGPDLSEASRGLLPALPGETSVTKRSPSSWPLSVAAVGVHLHRARERLRELLSGSLVAPRKPRAGTEDLSRSPS